MPDADFTLPFVEIRDAVQGDFGAICALNLAEVQHTSPMDESRLRELDRMASCHKVALVNDQVCGFLLAMLRGAPYRNDNFEWFSRTFRDFVYVDRIVVAAHSRGLGLGSRLYDHLFNWARERGIPRITCEYNILPANEPSRRFHETFGFREHGTQWVAHGTKRVSLQAAETGTGERGSTHPV